jgi:hypothetical protein
MLKSHNASGTPFPEIMKIRLVGGIHNDVTLIWSGGIDTEGCLHAPIRRGDQVGFARYEVAISPEGDEWVGYYKDNVWVGMMIEG